jgi:hypothetical protein
MAAGNARQRRPFPRFLDVTGQAEPAGNANYHALAHRWVPANR